MNKFTQFYLNEMNKRAAINWPSIIKKVKSVIALNAAPVGAAAGGGYLNYDENDPIRSAAIGAISGYGATHMGQGGAKLLPQTAKWRPMRAGLVGTSMLAGDVIIPQGREMMRTSKELNMADTALKLEQKNFLLNPPPAAPTPAQLYGPPMPTPAAPAPAAPAPVTINTPSKQNINLIPGGPAVQWAAGLTALGLSAAGIYALSQIARANKRKADGKETPPVTNINMTGGGGEGGAPGAPGAPAGPAKPSAGTLRVTLPTRNGKDNETQVEMPLEQIGLSKTLINKIRRDTKRRLRLESDGRTLHVVPPATAATKIARFTRRPLNFDHILKRADSTGLDTAPSKSSPPSAIPKLRAASPGLRSTPAVIKPGIVRPAKPGDISPEMNDQFKRFHGTDFEPTSRVDQQKLKSLPPIKVPQPPKAPAPAAPAPAAPAPLSATPVPFKDPNEEENAIFDQKNKDLLAASSSKNFYRDRAQKGTINQNNDIAAGRLSGFESPLPEPSVKTDSGYPGMSLTPSRPAELQPAPERLVKNQQRREDKKFLDFLARKPKIPDEQVLRQGGEVPVTD